MLHVIARATCWHHCRGALTAHVCRWPRLTPLPQPLFCMASLAAPSLPEPALLQVAPEAFIPYAGTGEATFLNSIAKDFSVEGYDPERTRKMFLELAIERLNQGPSEVSYEGELTAWAWQKREAGRVCRA